MSSRVDVSKTFRSTLIQNNFRSVSALFITWNLRTAIIQLWTTQKTQKIFREFLWNSADSDLTSADLFWNSAEQRWFLTYTEWKFLVSFTKLEFLLSFHKIMGEICIFWKRRMHFIDHFMRLHHFWLHYHNLIFPSVCFNIS